MIYTAVIKSPIGPLGIKLNDQHSFVTHIDFLNKNHALKSSIIPLIKQTINELNHYFDHPNYIINIPVQISGTDLQQKIWNIMKKIPVGKTVTYSDLAAKVKTSPRVIGNACRANPLPIFIPCHRVVAKNHLGGFAGEISGELINMKIWLINHEGGSQVPYKIIQY